MTELLRGDPVFNCLVNNDSDKTEAQTFRLVDLEENARSLLTEVTWNNHKKNEDVAITCNPPKTEKTHFLVKTTLENFWEGMAAIFEAIKISRTGFYDVVLEDFHHSEQLYEGDVARW